MGARAPRDHSQPTKVLEAVSKGTHPEHQADIGHYAKPWRAGNRRVLPRTILRSHAERLWIQLRNEADAHETAQQLAQPGHSVAVAQRRHQHLPGKVARLGGLKPFHLRMLRTDPETQTSIQPGSASEALSLAGSEERRPKCERDTPTFRLSGKRPKPEPLHRQTETALVKELEFAGRAQRGFAQHAESTGDRSAKPGSECTCRRASLGHARWNGRVFRRSWLWLGRGRWGWGGARRVVFGRGICAG